MRRSSRRSTMAVSLHQSLDNDAFTRVSTRISSSILPPFDDSRNASGNFTTKFSMSSFVKKVEELTLDQRIAIESVGFGSLLRIPHHTLRKNLLIEWMERWDCEKKAFLLLGEELTITPLDVALILGLRATGKPVTFSAEEPFCELEEEFGATKERKISVSSIEKRLQSLGDSADEEFIRTFILFTFGTLLFHNSIGKIDSRYLVLLQDLSHVANYAWGLAVVEDLFGWLSRKKEEGAKNVEGCLILLQIWSYEHIDIGRPNLLTESLEFPRACRWESIRSNCPRHWFTTKFKELEENQVRWKLEPVKAELNIDAVKELLLAETGGDEIPGQHHLSGTITTTKGTSKGLPPKALSQMPAEDVNKDQFIRMGKHDMQAECPESSCLSTDVSSVTVELSECSSAYDIQDGIEDQMLETSHNLREDYTVLKNENSELKRSIIELRKENDTLKDQLSLNSKYEELIGSLRNEIADLKKENESLRFTAAFMDDLERTLPETFITEDELLELSWRGKTP